MIFNMAEENINNNVESTPKNNLHIRKCPYCKQEYNTKLGLGNWKNLFRKPTIDDWIVLLIIVLLLVAAYAYTVETKSCREVFSNATRLDEICRSRIANQINYSWNGVPVIADLNYTVSDEDNSNTNLYSNVSE